MHPSLETHKAKWRYASSFRGVCFQRGWLGSHPGSLSCSTAEKETAGKLHQGRVFYFCTSLQKRGTKRSSLLSLPAWPVSFRETCSASDIKNCVRVVVGNAGCARVWHLGPDKSEFEFLPQRSLGALRLSVWICGYGGKQNIHTCMTTTFSFYVSPSRHLNSRHWLLSTNPYTVWDQGI